MQHFTTNQEVPFNREHNDSFARMAEQQTFPARVRCSDNGQFFTDIAFVAGLNGLEKPERKFILKGVILKQNP